MRIKTLAIAAAMLPGLGGCSGTASVKEAEARVAVFHQRLDKGDYEAVWRDSAEEITKGESKEKLVGLLAAIHGRFGNVKESKQQGWKVNLDNGVSTTEVTMRTSFDKGSLEEHFLYRATTGGLKLAGYEFQEK
jgi:hypothetical protein